MGLETSPRPLNPVSFGGSLRDYYVRMVTRFSTILTEGRVADPLLPKVQQPPPGPAPWNEGVEL